MSDCINSNNSNNNSTTNNSTTNNSTNNSTNSNDKCSTYNTYWVQDKKQYNKHLKNTTHYTEQPAHIRQFYNSKWWKRFRDYVIQQYVLCAECLKDNKVTEGTEVDHIITISTDEGWLRRLDLDNVQLLCKYHHSQKTAKEIAERLKQKQQVRIDYTMDDLESHIKDDKTNEKK